MYPVPHGHWEGQRMFYREQLFLRPGRAPQAQDGLLLGTGSVSYTHLETATLCDIEGCGCIKHIWLTTFCQAPQFLRKLVLEMYWDRCV